MSEASPDSGLVKTVGPLVGTALGTLLTWLTARWPGWVSSALSALLAIGGGICGLVFAMMYQRYIGVLGAGGEQEGSLERKAYDRVREDLATGNVATRLYVRWLTAFLDKVDRFFGDAGMTERTLFHRAFGLRTAVPLLTAPAFDRCLLLALVYPIAAIFVIWAVSGHAGPAETALGLMPNALWWQRTLTLAGIFTAVLAYFTAIQNDGWKFWAWYSFAFLVSIVVADAGPFAADTAFPYLVANAGAGIVLVTMLDIGAGIVAIVFAILAPYLAVIAFAPAGAVGVMNILSKKKGQQGVFLSICFLFLIALCFELAYSFPFSHSLLLFLGLLTLLNAPFDWVSLGLTRALLRRGVELGGWYPFLLGLLDAFFAVVTVTLLTLTMVIGIQAFNHAAISCASKLQPYMFFSPICFFLSWRYITA